MGRDIKHMTILTKQYTSDVYNTCDQSRATTPMIQLLNADIRSVNKCIYYYNNNNTFNKYIIPYLVTGASHLLEDQDLYTLVTAPAARTAFSYANLF